jgi:hypothetical protein
MKSTVGNNDKGVDRLKKEQRNPQLKSCHNCGGFGHYKRDCPAGWQARSEDSSEGSNSSSGGHKGGKDAQNKNSRGRKGNPVVGALLDHIAQLKGANDATIEKARHDKEDRISEKVVSPKDQLQSDLEDAVALQQRKLKLEEISVNLPRNEHVNPSRFFWDSVNNIINKITNYIWGSPSSPVPKKWYSEVSRLRPDIKVCDLNFNSTQWYWALAAYSLTGTVSALQLKTEWPMVIAHLDANIMTACSSMMAYKPLSSITSNYSWYEKHDMWWSGWIVGHLRNWRYFSFSWIQWLWTNSLCLIRSIYSTYLGRFLPHIFFCLFFYKTMETFIYGIACMHSRNAELRMEVQEIDVVEPEVIPRFDMEEAQPPRQIWVCRPFVSLNIFGYRVALNHPHMVFNTPEFLARGTCSYYYSIFTSVLAEYKTFNLSLNLLPEILNQRTLLANTRDPVHYVKRMIRFAETASCGQDSFAEFLRGRDAYRETLQFCLARATNSPNVWHLLADDRITF